MNESTNAHGAPSPRQHPATATHRTPDAIELESTVVRYEDRPDRWTIAPRECPEAVRTTTWLSADVRATVDLEDVR
ncbi:DUF7511 domain-containing protein [Natrinema salaciae]|uniref:DUF7511 domain-containing protein n=1 Tax=Natrinema salaciae TaxID=1186196 RepID=A0A1H9A2S3_9EURY|nr:hypothetical protein [Natrinema salaciae]SEP70915.1 hypothetical protein SAMN04489841_0333 [Natrinema salaciae]